MNKEEREAYLCTFDLIFLPISFFNTDFTTSSRPPSNLLAMLLITHCRMQ